MHDVFVSYSTKDKAVADAVVAGLEQEGLRCWIAPRDVLPGTNWGESIVSAIGSVQVMVLILSGNSNRSRQVINEVERAVSNDTIIIPFRIDAIDPSGAMALFVGSEHWLDALTPPLEQHIDRLAYSIDALRSADATADTRPDPVRATRPGAKSRIRHPLFMGGLVVAAIAIAAVVLFAALGGGGNGESATEALPETEDEATPPEETSATPTPATGQEAAAGGEGENRETNGEAAATVALVQFEDQFDGVLDEAWEWVFEEPDGWTLAEPGWLHITANDVEQNLLRRDPPTGDDYEIITAVKFRPTSNFQFAGLTVASSDGVSFVQLGRAYCDAAPPYCIGDGIYFDLIEEGESVANAYAAIAADTEVVHLRIVVAGSSFSGYYSEDGQTWIPVGLHLGSFTGRTIGITAHQAFEETAVAEFDYVSVSSPAASDPPASLEEVSAAYPDGQTCETTADVIAENADGSLELRFPHGTALFEDPGNPGPDDVIEFPCWGMRLAVLVDLRQQSRPYPAGSVLVLGPDSDASALIDLEGDSTSSTFGPSIFTWVPPDGLTFLTVES